MLNRGGPYFCSIALFSLVAACNQPVQNMQPGLRWDFEAGSFEGFSAEQTDFEIPTKGTLNATIETLPAPLSGKGLRITAFNHSDDQWVYISRHLTSADGLVPNRAYTATIKVRLASNTPGGCIGVGGNPDGLTLKGGVVNTEPKPLAPDAAAYVKFSADKGNQTELGSQAVDLGDIGNGEDCAAAPIWKTMDRSGSMSAVASAMGDLWVYVGTDSAFEGESTYAYDSIEVVLTPK